jgi:hypothetical protein
VAAQNQFTELPLAIPGQQIARGNLLRETRRSQFCQSKNAWFATKHEAKRSARLYHQPAATT